MTGITTISRDYGIVPSIVRILTTDTLATASAPGYITAQAANISLANNGAFTWQTSDFVAVPASDGGAIFSVSSDFTSLTYLQDAAALSASIAVSSAQFLGMYAAPVLLLAAPGANRLIMVNKVAFAMTYGSAQYASGGAIAAQYEATVHGAGTLATATLAAATINGLTASTVETIQGATAIAYANAVNQPLYLSNQTGAFTTGDSNFVVTVNYSIIKTA